MIEIDWSLYKNFSADEMRCHCGCGKADMKPHFMAALQWTRTVYGYPMPVTSGFRCELYEKLLDGVGIHPQGLAADIAVSGERVYHLLSAALIGVGHKTGQMRGIGIKQHGPHKNRYMHLDMLFGPSRPRIWTYP